MSAKPVSEQEGYKPTHHFGRGGAGNITSKPDKSPALVPSVTPTLKSKNYTTGRGGTGNIVENTDPETARVAQDIDVPGITLPEGDYHTGRGGGGNVYKPSEDEVVANRENNQKIRTESFAKDKTGLKGLRDKAKDILTGNKEQK
ncbi:hypothetical protein H2198_005857 [Neophaeococcomyces mojaviensis]|uniref:Uncharacterized protein n=1 Tax=Neophaeococcomyces mojaviensis TaxID=3383035 RepID=A0ACC3A591_9EURO|nr:hypothetical protein H2198_005857 [Knufia sp. JES_112]